MTFLTPIPAIVAAGVALPALVALYMLKLRRRPLRVSSTALWTSATQDLQGNIPWKWLRPGLLFLMHAMILLLLAGALGRPVSPGAGVGANARTILVIDASASMSARGNNATTEGRGPTTRLDEAKSRALKLVDSMALSGDARAMVVRFAGRAEALTGFTGSRAALRDAIRSIAPSDQPGEVEVLRQLLESLAALGRDESSGAGVEPGVLLLTDAVAGGELPAALPGTGVEEIRVGSEGPLANAGIVALAGGRDPRDPATARVFVRVSSNEPRARTVPVSLSVDGEPRETRGLALPPAGSGAPGEGSLTFELPMPRGGIVAVALGVEDALASDDGGVLVLPPPDPRSVVLVRGAEPGPHAWLLEESLRALRPESLREVSIESWEAWSRESQGADERPSVVVFDGCSPTAMPAVSSLSFGGSLPIAGLRAQGSAAQETMPIVWWSREHPVMRPVSLDGLLVERPLQYSWEEGSLPRGWKARELARTREGVVAAALSREDDRAMDDRVARHVLVGSRLADSNWPLLVSFAVFMGSAYDYLTLDEGQGRAWTTRDPISLSPRPGAREILASGPIAARADVRGGSGEVSLGVLERAGLYKVEGARATALGVNLLDAVESGLVPRREPLLVGRAQARAAVARVDRERWPWFVLVAGVLLVLEWLIFAWRLRA